MLEAQGGGEPNWPGSVFGLEGRFRVEYRKGLVEAGPGEMVLVPRSIEHRTAAEEEEAEVLIFEPAEIRNTGDVVDEVLTAPLGVSL